ncbi:protein takeout-like [Zophobas morio]|uniref:protein takeout-like n=1 Tax=Zophobas morio TaxID=2755281 RepID=UPI0030830540
MLLWCVVVAGCILGASEGVSLPKYIKLCRASDPEFDKCGLESGKEAIRHLVHGEKSLRLQPLSPLKLPFIQLENRADFQLNITDAEITGLDKAELVFFHSDLEKRDVKVVVHLSEIVLKGQFHNDGRILILPIKGEGPGVVKAFGGNYSYGFHYDLIKKKNQEFSKITKDEFSFTIEKAEFNVEKVFGDAALGKQTTQFLNENWLEVLKDFEQVIGATIGKICNAIASSVFERVPYNEIILP